MRILITGETYLPATNGQAVFTTNLAEGLTRRGHEVLAVIPSGPGHQNKEVRNGVHLEPVVSYSLKWLHADAYATPFPLRELIRIYRTFRPDMLHIQDHYPISRTALFVARQMRVKVIGTNHFMPQNLTPYLTWLSHFEITTQWLLWQWMLETFNRLDIAVAPSHTAASILRARGLRTPIYPISCGVDPVRFSKDPTVQHTALLEKYGLNPECKIFMFVGRIDGEKRLDVLLNAMRLLGRNDIQLAIAGQGAQRSELSRSVQAFGLEQQVRFLGFVPASDLPGLLNSVHFFVMPSEAELLSIATLEAMACGRPVLAARAQALPELVTDGVNGFLFRPGDAADAARYMALLADSPERWPGMQEASLEKAHLHSIDQTLKSYELVYELALSRSLQTSRQPLLKRIQKVLDQL